MRQALGMTYAQLGELNMYYEVHGSGKPTFLLHGAYMSVDANGPLLPRLAESRQVIAPEMQGHARTADIDRPISYEQMADDTAALARELKIEQADFVGYSMGGGVALQVAIRHPQLVRRLVLISTGFSLDSMHQVALDMFPSISPEMFAGSPIEEEYQRLAPNPADFPRLVDKVKAIDITPFTWKEGVEAITAPTLLIVGDSDGVRLEHMVEFFRLLGGGVMGDLQGMPKSQLAVLPNTAHYYPPGYGAMDRVDLLMAMIPPFLD
jgi:pimeloyl-ACP methyl ester carboxylesterase